MSFRRLFFLAPARGKKSMLEIVGLISYGIGWIWLLLALFAQIAGLVVDGPILFSSWPSSLNEWVIVVVAGFLFYPTIGLFGFFLFRGLTYLLARR